MRVLLFSPLLGLDPPSGDTTYTDVLLEHPPLGVAYTTYADALATGSVRERGRRPRTWTGPADVPVFVARMCLRLLQGRLLYREPTWWISVQAERFDLVHTHLFSLRQLGRRVPTVSSAGYPLSVLYRRREGWSARRVSAADRLRLRMARWTRSHVPGYYAPAPDVMSVYTETYRTWLVQRGMPADRVAVVGQGLPPRPAPPPAAGCPFGFIGREFRRKGGHLALEAFAVIRESHPSATLVVVTEADQDLPPAGPGVTYVLGATRSEVVSEHLPRINVLLAPTEADCGAPYGILEALRAGRPVVLTPNPWLDESLSGPGAVRAVRSVHAVSRSAVEVTDDLDRSSNEALALFEARYSLPTFHDGLLRAYRRALEDPRPAA